MSRIRRGPSLACAALVCVSLLPAAKAGELAGPYCAPSYLTNLWFGAHSHWLQPWRAYVETVPAARYLNAVGMGLNLNDRENPDVVLRMLARNGVGCGRIEIGWGKVEWNDETQLTGNGEHVRAQDASAPLAPSLPGGVLSMCR